MKTYIIIGHIDKVDRRTFEGIEDEVFNKKAFLEIQRKFKVYTLSEFMDACNNEEIDWDTHWMGYIRKR